MFGDHLRRFLCCKKKRKDQNVDMTGSHASSSNLYRLTDTKQKRAHRNSKALLHHECFENIVHYRRIEWNWGGNCPSGMQGRMECGVVEIL
jgi:hypothetical protein